MEKKHCLKMTTMTDLLLSRGSTKYKEQVEKLLESQPAVKKDRAGELALGNSFLGLPGRGVVSRLGVQGRLKNRVGGRGRGEMARGGGSGPRSGADLETPKTQLYQHASHFFAFFAFFLHFFNFFSHVFCFFCIFFAFPKLGVICFAFFLHFPDWESFFWRFFAFPKPAVIFCIFLHFLHRVCHLHRLPDPYEKTTRKWTMLESRKRQENDKKWQENDKKMT